MTDVEPATGSGLGPAFAASRAQLGLVVVLFALAAVGWWWTVQEMRGMDDGPWSSLGPFGWFLGVWVVMMTAMMFPSVSPTVALYSRMTKSRWLPVAFTTGYLATWAGAGVVAFMIGVAGRRVAGGDLAWEHAGQAIAGATLIAAAVYELTPLKNACLGKCRSPLGTLLGSWREGGMGALRMGVGLGAWCVGCCWALMASLFALGVMSVTWMAVVAGLIAFEKVVPWRRVATYGTTLILVVLGMLVLAAPDALPGFNVPGDTQMPGMTPMGP
jgi:predicted metal-binding membrane protein